MKITIQPCNSIPLRRIQFMMMLITHQKFQTLEETKIMQLSAYSSIKTLTCSCFALTEARIKPSLLSIINGQKKSGNLTQIALNYYVSLRPTWYDTLVSLMKLSKQFLTMDRAQLIMLPAPQKKEKVSLTSTTLSSKLT